MKPTKVFCPKCGYRMKRVSRDKIYNYYECRKPGCGETLSVPKM